MKKILLKYFEFLKSEFDFKLVKQRKDVVLYMSTNVAVEIYFEVKDGWLSLKIYKLLNGTLERNDVFINTQSKIYGVELADLIEAQTSTDEILPLYNYPEKSLFRSSIDGFEKYIEDISIKLKKYASSELKGNFVNFDKAIKIVKTRINNNS